MFSHQIYTIVYLSNLINMHRVMIHLNLTTFFPTPVFWEQWDGRLRNEFFRPRTRLMFWVGALLTVCFFQPSYDLLSSIGLTLEAGDH